MTPADVVEFWVEAGPRRWFAKDDHFDAEISRRFGALHHSAARRELDGWAGDAQGALALLLLLDQFPRNMFRGSAHAFATDPLARHFARVAVDAGFDRAVDAPLRNFFYLPFEHSEALADQDLCVALCADSSESDRHWSILHRDIIQRFGRFPHRNAELGRESTAEEEAFLLSGGFAG
jgi:uncharacterized protein (DUF924 family)